MKAVLPLRSIGLWPAVKIATSLLLAHGNYLDPMIRAAAACDDCLLPRGLTRRSVIRRTRFENSSHRGVRVALGTDSLASNPDLDVLAEARFIRQLYPDFSGEMLLKMATLAGAEALGFGKLTGSLEAGKSADLAVVPLPNRDEMDAYELLFSEVENAERKTMWRGGWRPSVVGKKI